MRFGAIKNKLLFRVDTLALRGPRRGETRRSHTILINLLSFGAAPRNLSPTISRSFFRASLGKRGSRRNENGRPRLPDSVALAWSQVCLRARSLRPHTYTQTDRQTEAHSRATEHARIQKAITCWTLHRRTLVSLSVVVVSIEAGATRDRPLLGLLSRISLAHPPSHRTVSNSSRNLAASAEAVSPLVRIGTRTGQQKRR